MIFIFFTHAAQWKKEKRKSPKQEKNGKIKENAISIPESYTSYAAPISSMTLYNQVRRNVRRNETYIRAFEAPYVVRMHNKYILSGKLTIYELNKNIYFRQKKSKKI